MNTSFYHYFVKFKKWHSQTNVDYEVTHIFFQNFLWNAFSEIKLHKPEHHLKIITISRYLGTSKLKTACAFHWYAIFPPPIHCCYLMIFVWFRAEVMPVFHGCDLHDYLFNINCMKMETHESSFHISGSLCLRTYQSGGYIVIWLQIDGLM